MMSSNGRGVRILNFTEPRQESKRTVMASQCSLERAFGFVSGQGWASQEARNEDRALRESMTA